MKKLVVKNSDNQIIGIVKQNEDGSLLINSKNQQFQVELEKIIQDITSRPIYVRKGETVKTNEGEKHNLVAIEIGKESPDYLSAIAYQLWNFQIDNKGIFGKVSENK
jgi:hypothetical protein